MKRRSFAFGMRILINLSICTHILIISIWALPSEIPLKGILSNFFSPYVLYAGLWQGWEMFAPEPRRTLLVMDAEVIFRDGTRKIWNFPRMEKLGIWEKFQKERYRKWAYDNVRLDQNSKMWPATAQYIARLHWSTQNPPVSVSLNRRWYDLPVAELNLSRPPEEQWSHDRFFTEVIAHTEQP